MEKKKKLPEINKDSFLILQSLTNTFMSIFLVFNILLLLLYITGNFQFFMNKTQNLILNIQLLTAISMCIMAIIGFISNIVFIIINKSIKKRMLSFFYMLFCLVFGVILIIFSSTIMNLAVGI